MEQTSKTTEKVHNLIILDESGSMDSIKKQIISGFNEIAQNIKDLKLANPHQTHTISFVSFNTAQHKVFHFMEDVDCLQNIDMDSYQPNGGTPLFDALGFALNKLHQSTIADEDAHVFVTVLTDGLENASREYHGKQIKHLIENLKELNWTFTYIGADHDVAAFAESMSINSYMSFDKSESGIKQMFAREKTARMKYTNASDKGMFKFYNMFLEDNNDLDDFETDTTANNSSQQKPGWLKRIFKS